MRTLICFCITAGLLAPWHAPIHASGLTGQELGQHCLSTCEVIGRGGLTVEEIASPDICIGYVKAVMGATRAFPLLDKTNEVKVCAAKLLGPRTAQSPDKDELLIAACNLGEWVSTRPSLLQRPATTAFLQWVGATSCSGK